MDNILAIETNSKWRLDIMQSNKGETWNGTSMTKKEYEHYVLGACTYLMLEM